MFVQCISIVYTVWIQGSRESSSGDAAGVSKESNECGRCAEIMDDDICNDAGEMDKPSADDNLNSGEEFGPLILWFVYEWGDEEDPEDEGQGDRLVVDESTDPIEMEQPKWLFENTEEILFCADA